MTPSGAVTDAPSRNDNPDVYRVHSGECVHVYWSEDQRYYDGTVKHLHRDDCVTVHYNNGEV